MSRRIDGASENRVTPPRACMSLGLLFRARHLTSSSHSLRWSGKEYFLEELLINLLTLGDRYQLQQMSNFHANDSAACIRADIRCALSNNQIIPRPSPSPQAVERPRRGPQPDPTELMHPGSPHDTRTLIGGGRRGEGRPSVGLLVGRSVGRP